MTTKLYRLIQGFDGSLTTSPHQSITVKHARFTSNNYLFLPHYYQIPLKFRSSLPIIVP